MTTTANTKDTQGNRPATVVDSLTVFANTDLYDLCDAAETAIVSGGGFGWLTPPPRQVMETYWKGVLLVPERELFVARLDRTICGSAQLQRAPRNNEAQALSGNLTTSFMAPWARGHGLARLLVLAVEAAARAADLRVLNLDVRESQDAAIKLYESLGYRLWGRHPHYARIGEQWVTGLYYFKDLRAPVAPVAPAD